MFGIDEGFDLEEMVAMRRPRPRMWISKDLPKVGRL